MKSKLTVEEFATLKEILARRCSDCDVLLVHDGHQELTRIQRERIVDALSSELSETGIRDDGELSPRGVQLDRLVGYFVPYDQAMG